MREVRDIMADLAASGLSGPQIALVMELSASLAASAKPAKDEAAERRREKDRDRKRVRGNPRKSAETTDSAETPPSLSPSPEPLSTIPTQLPPIVPQKVDVSQLAERLWSLANPDGRERSGKSAVRKAVSAALVRGATPDQLEADVRRHYAEADRGKRDNAGKTFAKGLHRRIEGDHWSGCKPADPAKPLEPATPEIQACRLQHLRDTGEWKPIWGTPPEVGRLEPFRPVLVSAA